MTAERAVQAIASEIDALSLSVLNPRVITPNCLTVQDCGVGGVITFLGNNVTTNDLLTMLYDINQVGANCSCVAASTLGTIETDISGTTNVLLNAILGQLVVLTTATNNVNGSIVTGNARLSNILAQVTNSANSLVTIASSTGAIQTSVGIANINWSNYLTHIPSAGSSNWR